MAGPCSACPRSAGKSVTVRKIGFPGQGNQKGRDFGNCDPKFRFGSSIGPLPSRHGHYRARPTGHARNARIRVITQK